MTSFDTHLIPGTGLYTIIANGKVRFDESGRSKLGESADAIPQDASVKPKPLWGPWFGFNLNMVVDESVATNDEMESINTFDYRITFKPHDTVITL